MWIINGVRVNVCWIYLLFFIALDKIVLQFSTKPEKKKKTQR